MLVVGDAASGCRADERGPCGGVGEATELVVGEEAVGIRLRRQRSDLQSGSRVQVGFAKPFFAVLRSVCGPNPRRAPACAGGTGVARPSALTGARPRSIRRRGGGCGARQASAKQRSQGAPLRYTRIQSSDRTRTDLLLTPALTPARRARRKPRADARTRTGDPFITSHLKAIQLGSVEPD